MFMFSIGFLEICVICVVSFVLIGPKNLPKVMIELGKFFVQIRRVTNEVKNSVTEAVRDANFELEKERDLNIKKSRDELKAKVETFLESEVFCEKRQELEDKQKVETKKL